MPFAKKSSKIAIYKCVKDNANAPKSEFTHLNNAKGGIKRFFMRFSNLEAEITRTGLSVEEVGKELGFTKCTIYNRLACRSNWTLKDMLKVQKFINDKLKSKLTLDYLFAQGD